MQPYLRVSILTVVVALGGCSAAKAQELTQDQVGWLRSHASDPDLGSGWARRAAAVWAQREALRRAGTLHGLRTADAAALGAALSGTIHLPVIAVTYPDVSAPFPAQDLAEALFGSGGSPDTVTLSEYYAEVSNGLLTLSGDVTEWIVLDSAAAYYLSADEYAWAERGRFSEWKASVMSHADSVVDFGAYDNDGPDGEPNSGDDDGLVDLLVILYGTDCTGEWKDGFLWPGGGWISWTTQDSSANGGFIHVGPAAFMNAQRRSVCVPVYSGVLAHEIGHAIGLPDLYDYDFSSSGIGYWGLMGYGLYAREYSPAYLSAWSRERLGWITVDEVERRLSVPPTETDHLAYRFDAWDSNEYFLLEHRRRIGSDAYLPGEGLLIWHVDPDTYSMNDETHKRVDLEEADGGSLDWGTYGDARDPFPGAAEVRRFGPLSVPSSDLYDGRGSRLLVERITAEGEQSVSAVLPQLVADGDSIPGLQGASGTEHAYWMIVDPGAPLLWVQTEGGTGDVDLDVVRELSSEDPRCRSSGPGTAESCLIAWPEPGVWLFVLRGAADFAEVTLAATTQHHPEPVIALTPDAMRDTLCQSEGPRDDTLTVWNIGGGTLTWRAEEGASWVTVNPTEGSLGALESARLVVTIDPAGLAATTHTASVTIESNGLRAAPPIQVGLHVVAAFSLEELVDAVLGFRSLSEEQTAYVDRRGNANGMADVGDLVAWLDEHGGAHEAMVMLRSLAERRPE